MDITRIKRHVLEGISLRSRGSKTVDGVVASINKALGKKGIKAACIVGGSFAKGTNLKNDFDVDLFARFDYKKYLDVDKKSRLPGILEPVLAELFPNVEKIHGSRDYFHFSKGKFDFEVVPVLDIDDSKRAVNVTDMSPLHVDWVKKHKKSDEIMLSKMFCKAAKCYGAESYINGFSGHVLDILTIYYGSFEGLIKAASRWGEEIKKKGKIIIDIDNMHKGNALQRLNRSKTNSPLILIDPILPERNAAAALSREKFDIFAERAKQFIRKPSLGFFRKKALAKPSIKAGKNKLIFMKAKAVKGKPDVVGAKLLKAFTYIKKQLRLEDFAIKTCGWEFDKEKKEALMYFVIDPRILSGTKIREGPPLRVKKHVEDFKKKHKDIFIKKDRLFARIKRKHRGPESLIDMIIKSDYVNERVGKIRVLK